MKPLQTNDNLSENESICPLSKLNAEKFQHSKDHSVEHEHTASTNDFDILLPLPIVQNIFLPQIFDGGERVESYPLPILEQSNCPLSIISMGENGKRSQRNPADIPEKEYTTTVTGPQSRLIPVTDPNVTVEPEHEIKSKATSEGISHPDSTSETEVFDIPEHPQPLPDSFDDAKISTTLIQQPFHKDVESIHEPSSEINRQCSLPGLQTPESMPRHPPPLPDSFPNFAILPSSTQPSSFQMENQETFSNRTKNDSELVIGMKSKGYGPTPVVSEEYASDLPPGWLKQKKVRCGGKSKGAFDTYWFSPKLKKKFRSKVEINLFLSIMEANQNDENVSFALFKSVRDSSRMMKKGYDNQMLLS